MTGKTKIRRGFLVTWVGPEDADVPTRFALDVILESHWTHAGGYTVKQLDDQLICIVCGEDVPPRRRLACSSKCYDRILAYPNMYLPPSEDES